MKTYTYIETSIGKMLLLAEYDSLTGIYLEQEINRQILDDSWQYNPQSNILQVTRQQIIEYLNKQRTTFILKYHFTTGTKLQQSVWNSLVKIGYGKLQTYKDIAAVVGKPKAVRAVANAIGRNPLLLLIPCHRVIGSDNKLRGFSAGVEIKEQLLRLESES